MRALLTSTLLLASLGASAQTVQPPDVTDRTLGNGVKVLMVERPGTGAVRAGVFIRGGRARAGELSPGAADLLARTLFRRLPPASLDKDLDLILRQEDAAFEALRLERLREARRPDRTPSSELPGLEAMHRTALAAIQDRLVASDAWDDLDALGGTHRSLEVAADHVGFGIDVPAAKLVDWFRIEANHLAKPFLGRFPLERERLLQELDAGNPPCPPTLSVLLSMSLAGRPYAQACEFQRRDVEALTLPELRGLAGQFLVPGRMTLVLVGDFRKDALLPDLEATFGSLRGPQAEAPAASYRDDDTGGGLESPAGRRLFVSTTGDTRVLFGWRIPPASHPDGPALRALAQILAGSPSARLIQGLVTTRGLAKTLTLRVGVPGERDMNLLVIDAEPAAGHAPAELQQAIEGELLRLQREPLPEAEVRRAQTQLESAEILLQEDAAALARALGVAQCELGDWRMAFHALTAGRNLRPGEIQAAARTYLNPSRQTVAQFGPDPLLQPQDRTEARLLQVLSALVQRRLTDPVQAQEVVREAIRQLRMLSGGEREQTLKLLEAQVNP